jgi:hypothetical protein
MLKINFSPALFILIIISFFLPFVSLNCSGTKFQQFSGVDLAVGKAVHPNDPSMSAKVPPNQSVRELWATVALLAAIIGLILSLRPLKKKILALAVSGSFVFLSLLLLMGRISSELSNGEYAGALQAEYLFGYWMAFLLSLVIGGVNGYLVLVEKDKS